MRRRSCARGHLRLRDGLCHTLFATARAIIGHEEGAGRRRERGAPPSLERGAETWTERRRRQSGTRRDPGPWVGELRNMWKPTRQPGLWLQGGNLQQARHYSRILALQIQARMLGLATPVQDPKGLG